MVTVSVKNLMRAIALAAVAAMMAPASAGAQAAPRLPDLELEDLLGVDIQRVRRSFARPGRCSTAPGRRRC